MIPSEIFSLIGHDTIESEQMIEYYWDIEFSLARELGIPYTYTENKDALNCALCGSFNQSDLNGNMPRRCKNAKCQVIREFWELQGTISQITHYGYHARPRTMYLRSRIKSTFGNEFTLSRIPRELLLTFLLNTMIERITHERK